MTTYTSLNKIRQHNPPPEMWAKLLSHLGKTEPDDAPLTLTTVMESVGLPDAVYCLRFCDETSREALAYGIWCQRQVQKIAGESVGQETEQDLHRRWAAAWDAALPAHEAEFRRRFG